jgi:hypothetical protein
VLLPAGWEIAPATPGGPQPTAIHYKGSPGFEVTVQQNDTAPHAEAVVSLPFECDFMVGAIRAATKFQMAPRPDFIPGEYHSRVLMPAAPNQGQVLFTCLYLGKSQLGIMVRPAPGSGDGSKLTPMLQAISDSAKPTSTLLYAPGSLKLPVLRVTASMSSGIWAAGTTSLPGSTETRDLLVRVSGTSEVKIVPKMLPGVCSLGINPDHKKSPPYLSAQWEPAAWETSAPNGQLVLTVCRQIAPAKMLLMTILYGAPEVPAGDAGGIATALDEIAGAIIKGQR